MGRVALITGGASGIGRACAETLAAQGVKVTIADVDESKGIPLAKEIGGAYVDGDLTKREECKAAVEKTVDTFGGLDILVNNAGFQHIEPIGDFPEDRWDTMLSLMLTAPFLLTKYAWEHLKKSGHGRVIHMGSIHSVVASPYKAAYVSAKHGLLGLMRVTSLEGGEFGITCNTVCPAYVRTPLVERQIADQAKTRGLSLEEVEEKVFLEPAAVKRLLEPQNVASYVTYLASEEAWGITGATATIDLGWTAK